MNTDNAGFELALGGPGYFCGSRRLREEERGVELQGAESLADAAGCDGGLWAVWVFRLTVRAVRASTHPTVLARRVSEGCRAEVIAVWLSVVVCVGFSHG
jgi:hypothetical protein